MGEGSPHTHSLRKKSRQKEIQIRNKALRILLRCHYIWQRHVMTGHVSGIKMLMSRDVIVSGERRAADDGHHVTPRRHCSCMPVADAKTYELVLKMIRINKQN